MLDGDEIVIRINFISDDFSYSRECGRNLFYLYIEILMGREAYI